jgi:uncharacterized protein (DUF433 family)
MRSEYQRAEGVPNNESAIMPKFDDRRIEEDPARCGGQPVIAGTRIRVATILTCYRGGSNVEEIVGQYPPLKPADVHDALAYAHEHLDEIEANLADDNEATAKARSAVDAPAR